MKKLVLLLSILFFINSTFAQSYIEPLNKLNKYLKTIEKGYYGPFEVVDGFLIYNSQHKTNFYKKEIKFISFAFLLNPTDINAKYNSVLFKCTDEKKWICPIIDYDEFSIRIVAKNEDCPIIIKLINDFIEAYNQDFNLSNNSLINEQQSNRNRLKKEEDEKESSEQAEREKNPSVCVCPKCKGTGELWAKQLDHWEIDNGTDKYGNKKTIKQTGYTNQYFSVCPKCLGDGKCH